MSKGKLAKFADMASYPHVFECPFKAIGAPGSEVSTPLPNREGQGGESGTRSVADLIGRWHQDFFHNQNPIVLELGCGRGEYTVGLARRYPDRNFIGVDIKGARMWTGATESLREGLQNVAFLRTNIEIIDRFFAPGEVQEIWLTFSDPQMKKAERNHLPVEACTEDLYGSAPEHSEEEGAFDLSIRTYYEQQWLSRGITIKYLRFRLPAEGDLTEPDVEIPLDDYRSYNREKRSSLTTSK